jgi:hypothetical protein
MWAPLAALLLIVGVLKMPGMMKAERQYLRDQEPAIEVQEIEASKVDSQSDQGTADPRP